MIKASVMYPYQEGARFDHAYYKDKHMHLVKRLMGPACLYYSVEKGIGGAAPGKPPLYEAVCHIHAESVEAFLAAFGPHLKEISGDVPNFTDIRAVMQISEVMVERGE
ncbi:MAG: EthD family reductase [Proteobacteria bacterium]|jgi:uncharacterized protein (TIGR02118 family)|nr:EthD family reductase [Pseudomonadota bacterium]